MPEFTVGREFYDFKAVVSGSHEYSSVIVLTDDPEVAANTGNFRLGANDSLSMVFDGDVTIDDISVRGGDGFEFNVYVVYPSGNFIKLSDGTSVTTFSINRPGSQNNVWYRLPRGSKVKISFVSVSAASFVQLSAIGRA